MNIAVISFTRSGYDLSSRIKAVLAKHQHLVEMFVKSKYLQDTDAMLVEASLPEWAGRMFHEKDAIIFVGASGIAVRAIAPHIQDKRYDPAVLILDEQGNFCIPLLAGHLGGANELAQQLAKDLGAGAVITTATDLNGWFAVDIFAKKNQLYITDMKLAKEISAQLLHGGEVGFCSELPMCGTLPKGLTSDTNGHKLGIYVGIHSDRTPFHQTLQLIPQNVVLGLGCKKGTSETTIEALVQEACQLNSIHPAAIFQLCSIDLKKDESGIINYCKRQGLPFITYTSAELNEITGEFTSSAFVSSVTGVDNVCERSAVLGSQMGTIIQKKIGKNGVTVALARLDRSVYFE